MTLKKNNSPYVEYYNGNLIKTVCEQFVENDIMFKRDEQYYFILLGNEVFRPEFPKEYDTLLIEYFDAKWLIPRNKIIDQFVRKSIWVDNLVIGSNDKYILKFLLKGKEIFTIPYNDISYPESAVKIMSDVIIKNIVRV